MVAARDASTYLLISALCISILHSRTAIAAEPGDPIAYIGHGAFFDSSGKQIQLTQEFVDKAQAYYRQKLLSLAPRDKADGLVEAEKGIAQLQISRQGTLLLQNRLLGALASSPADAETGRIASILNALSTALKTQIPEREPSNTPIRKFVPEPRVREFFERQAIALQQKSTPFVSTINSGQQYLDECRSNGVPIPPPVGKLDPQGTNGWRSLGFIPKEAQFIVGTPAEVRVFSSTNPVGMCVALPRYSDDTKQTVALDGVICLGQLSSKVCFWDNQMPATDAQGVTGGRTFEFGAGEQIPIGVPDLKVDPQGRFQGGGFDLNNGEGGVCTNCHAGENPYIVHPKIDLGGGVLMGKLNKPPLNLPTFSMDRYDPLVPPSWPQNGASEAASKVPSACSVCHEKDGPGGRFPQLSSALQGYCGTILRLAIEKTMPPSSPGSLKNDAEITKFFELCAGPADTKTADLTP